MMKEDNRILLIADNRANMDDIVSHLASKGMTLKSTFDPGIGKQLFEREAPDIVLLNFRTLKLAIEYYQRLFRSATPPQVILLCTASEVSEVVRRLKANPNLKDITIVVVTSPTSKETLQRILEMEEAGSIAKPIRRQLVLEKVQQFSHRS